MLSHKTDFERLVPTRHRVATSVDIVRVAFQKIKEATDTNPASFKLKMYIGKELARKFQWKPGERVAVEISRSDPRVLRLIKVDSSDLQSYKLTSQPGQHHYTIAITWKKFEPSAKECMTKIVHSAPHEGGLVLYLH